MSQSVWRVVVHGRQNAQSNSYDTTYFRVSVVAQSKEQAKAAALAYVSAKAAFLDEPGPYRAVWSHQTDELTTRPHRFDGEVVGLEIRFTGR